MTVDARSPNYKSITTPHEANRSHINATILRSFTSAVPAGGNTDAPAAAVRARCLLHSCPCSSAMEDTLVSAPLAEEERSRGSLINGGKKA